MRSEENKKFSEVLTPQWLIDKMVTQAGDLKGKKVADLGANRGQYLEAAIRIWDVDPKDWILLEIQEMYKRYHRRYTGWRVEEELTESVDLIIGNPPWNGNVDLKLLFKYRSLTKRLVCVHPSIWLVDVKTQLPDTPVIDKKTDKPKLKKDGTVQINQSGNSTFRKFQDAVRDHVTNTELFNGNPVFGIGLFVPCVITAVNFDAVRKGAIKVKDVGSDDFREVLSIDDITLHGSDWDPTVKEFMGRVHTYCTSHSSLWDPNHMIRDFGTSDKKPDTSKYYAQLAAIRGHVSAESMVQGDFYTFVQKDPENNRGVRQPDLGRAGNPTPTYSFLSSREVDNFLNYCQTDFARMCLALTKIGQNLATGELALVPWMDFTRSWTDAQLFTALGYAKGHPIREYAKKFLPDFHGIYTIKDESGNDIIDKSSY